MPPNADLRLYGGAAFERALSEFQEAANVMEFPIGTIGMSLMITARPHPVK